MSKQRKIWLWSVPRSCSTVFSMAISKQEYLKVVIEPFTPAYFHGEDRISKRFQQDTPKASLTFNSVKHSLENDYNDYSAIFVKDMAYNIRYYLDRFHEVLPDGYKHTFLIRHPSKTVSSLYIASTNNEASGYNYFDKDEAEFKTLHDLFFKIMDETEDTPIVVEADDLLEHPDVVLNMYCQKTGLSYSENMLSWDQGGFREIEAAYPGWQSTLMKSTGFRKPSLPIPVELASLPEEAKEAIEENLEYYNVLSKYKTPLP